MNVNFKLLQIIKDGSRESIVPGKLNLHMGPIGQVVAGISPYMLHINIPT